MTEPKRKRGRPKKIEPDAFTLQLILGERVFESEGSTLLEALYNLEQPPKIVSKGFLTIKTDEKQVTQNLTVPQTKRLFFPLARHIVAKQLMFLLK